MRFLSGLAVVAVVLGLAACQMTEPPGDQPGQKGPPVEVAVFSTPHAQVYVDGSEAGTTPTILKLPPGTHEVTFRKDGFKEEVKSIDVKGEDAYRLEVELVVESPNETSISELAESMEIERDPFDEEAIVHRGATGEGITLIWPLGQVRIESLESYRIDVDSEYAGDGYMEFRKGNDVLYHERFNATELVSMGPIPSAVLEQAGVNSKITWGIVFDDPDKGDVLVEFKVIKKPRAARRMAMLSQRRHFQRQPPLVQEILLADVLRSNGLMAEALQRYLAIAQEYPTSTLPMKGMMTALRRMGLTESWFYAEAAERAQNGGPELPLPLRKGPKLADLPDPAVPPGPDTNPDPKAGRNAVVAAGLVQIAADLEVAARQSRDDGRAMTRLARETKRLENELAMGEAGMKEAGDALAQAEEELKQAKEEAAALAGAGTQEEAEAVQKVSEASTSADAARTRFGEISATVAKIRNRMDAVLAKSGGMSSEAAQAAAQAQNRRSAQLMRTAREARQAADHATAGGSSPASLIQAADALQMLADWLDAEAGRLEDGIGQAAQASQDYKEAVANRKMAEEALARMQAEYDDAAEAAKALAGAANEEEAAAQQAVAEAEQKLAQHRNGLEMALDKEGIALTAVSDAVKATNGLPPPEARAAVTADRAQATALREQAAKLRVAASAR